VDDQFALVVESMILTTRNDFPGGVMEDILDITDGIRESLHCVREDIVGVGKSHGVLVRHDKLQIGKDTGQFTGGDVITTSQIHHTVSHGMNRLSNDIVTIKQIGVHVDMFIHTHPVHLSGVKDTTARVDTRQGCETGLDLKTNGNEHFIKKHDGKKNGPNRK